MHTRRSPRSASGRARPRRWRRDAGAPVNTVSGAALCPLQCRRQPGVPLAPAGAAGDRQIGYAQTWRESTRRWPREGSTMTLTFHPLAEVFPLLEGEEFQALVTDIAQNGLR